MGPPDAASVPLDSGSDGGLPDAEVDAGSSPELDSLVARFGDPGITSDELDALIHEVAWGLGWPATDGTRWLFATRWDDAPGSVSLVGDVVGWAPGRVANVSASGVHYWLVVDDSEFVVDAEGALYKWRASDGGIFRAPPEATRYGFDENGLFGYVAAPLDRRWRERFPDFESSHLGATRAFRALLPAGFVPGSASAADARTFFAHDGQNLFAPDAPHGGWRVDEALEASASWDDVVVLAVDNAADRMSAYTHVPDDIGGGPLGGQAEDYLDLVEDEALPFFRARYGVAAAGDSLAIAGSSLGGLVTLYGAMTRPAMAGCAIAMSSTLGWGAFGSDEAPDALVNRWDTHGPVALYLGSGGTGTCSDGDGDGVAEDSEDSDNLCTSNQLRDRLVALGYVFDVDLFHWHEPGGLHDEAAWAMRVPRALAACASSGWVGP